MRIRDFGIALTAISAMTACKPRSDGVTKLKHTFGQTSAPRAQAPDPCKNMGEDTPEFRYANALIDYITSKNPDTFSGNLARKYICVQIMKSDGLNASMEAATGTMRFFKKILHLARCEVPDDLGRCKRCRLRDLRESDLAQRFWRQVGNTSSCQC